MALASLLGGLCLANAGLGAVHGLAAPIGGMFGAPHGAVCAALLPYVLGTNLRALRRRHPEHRALRRLAEVATMLTTHQDAAADDAVDWLAGVCRDLGIPTLSTYGIADADTPAIVEQALGTSSMKGNPIPLTEAELTAALRAAM